MKRLNACIDAFGAFSMLIFLLWSCNPQEEPFDPNKESIFDRFARDSTVHLTIETDFQHLLENKADGEYQAASLVCQELDGGEMKKDILVSARGVTRRKICAFPPLKFRFSKEELASEDLQEFHTLKLVTHCQDSIDSEQLLLKEYLTYRLLNVLTPQSFQVQLARVKYVDVHDRYPSREKYAFLIENNKEMATRLNAKLLDEDEYELKAIDKENYNLLALFQFMIGNTDWNLSRHHNVKLLLPQGSEVPLAVPYDFDYSGLVNAPYAVPYASLPISNVRERFLQWRGQHVAELEPAIRIFQEKKEGLLLVCRNMNELHPNEREDMVRYLNSFFDLLNDPERLEREVMRKN